ncbi:unnamed protein product [Diatraea saccharalis]|nr:unnamed protein product [Diatraea saccharalis]
MKQTKITDLNTGIESSLKTSVKYSNKPVKKKTTTETKPRTRRPLIRKGKPDADTTSTSDVQKSPSLLEQLENKSPKIENVVSNESPVKENLEACTIGSRKTSTTGVSECLSWTKDISSSSTVTSLTASSNDFVRIDKKIPILKLTNIDNQIKVETLNNPQPSSDAGSSSSSSSGSNSSESTLNRDARSLDLSTSSVTPTKSRNSNGNSEANNHINYITALDRLTAKLKTFDLEIINWIGYDETDLNMDIKKFQDNVFRILKEESQVITHCQRLKQVLSDNNQEDNANDLNNREQTAENTGNSDIVIPVNANRNNILGQGIRNDDSVGNNNNLIGELKSPSKVVNDNTNGNGNNFTSEKYRYTNFENNYDDDDALSLFAESITGIESSRLNSSTASVMSIANNSTGHFEEYIPQPLSREQWDSVNKISYIPSKIVNTDVQSLDNKKTICEKHRADSTSITKDVELDKNEIPLNIENNLNTTEKVFNQHDQCTIIEKKKMPCLMSSLFKSLHGIKSIVFRGMCFFYLISSCKNPRCRFPHVKPDLNEISSKLVRLSEEVFIQEYMLLRNWPDLRRKYGMCFVEECKRRELTRFLVEMAIDFYMKANENYIEDCNLRVIVMECTLLYLNTVNLATCEDLLLFNVQQDLLLCDVFMKTIADTQNFSRFKQVFINLTNFIVHHDKTFNLDVGTQILERVCILPYEQSLTEALIEMISHTDQVIFDNSMIGIFEKQLSSKNKDLYEKFLACKQAKLERPMSKNPEIPPCINPDVEPVINTSLIHTEREKRYTSPDTTNLDNTNKSTDEPIFTRTIDFNRVRNIGVNIQRSFSNSNSTISNDSTEESGPQITPVPTPNFQTWKGQTVFNKFRNYSRAAPPQGSYQRPPLIKRRIHQLPNFGPSPSVCIQ